MRRLRNRDHVARNHIGESHDARHFLRALQWGHGTLDDPSLLGGELGRCAALRVGRLPSCLARRGTAGRPDARAPAPVPTRLSTSKTLGGAVAAALAVAAGADAARGALGDARVILHAWVIAVSIPNWDTSLGIERCHSESVYEHCRGMLLTLRSLRGGFRRSGVDPLAQRSPGVCRQHKRRESPAHRCSPHPALWASRLRRRRRRRRLLRRRKGRRRRTSRSWRRRAAWNRRRPTTRRRASLLWTSFRRNPMTSHSSEGLGTSGTSLANQFPRQRSPNTATTFWANLALCHRLRRLLPQEASLYICYEVGRGREAASNGTSGGLRDLP